MIQPSPTEKEAGTTSERSTDPQQKGTPKADQAATPSGESTSSDDDM